jgi:hypothetical protein
LATHRQDWPNVLLEKLDALRILGCTGASGDHGE